MVMLRTVQRSRRAASVPVGEPDVSIDADYTTHNSLLFSKAAIDNTDALSTASKHHDQQFLQDLNLKLVNSPFSKPYAKTVRKTYSHPSVSPLVAKRRSIAVSSLLRAPPVAADDPDVDYEVHLIAPLTSRLTRAGSRATSVPPLHTTTHMPRTVRHTVLTNDLSGSGLENFVRPILVSDDAEFYHTPATYEHLRHLTSQKQPAVTTSEYGQKLNPVAELAVRQAHRNLDRIESELKSSGDVIISRPLSPQFHRHRSISYHGPRSATIRTRSVSPAPVAHTVTAPPIRRHVRTSYANSSAPVFCSRSSSSKDLEDYMTPKEITGDLSFTDDPELYHTHVYRARSGLPISYSALVSPSVKRSVVTGDNVSRKTLYDVDLYDTDNYVRRPTGLSSSVVKKITTDNYSPSLPHFLHSVTPHSVISHETIGPHKVTLHSLTPSTTITTHSYAPLKPPTVPKQATFSLPPPAAQTIPSGLPPITRPRVSETRRKVRDVLCKVKGDPHYFDY